MERNAPRPAQLPRRRRRRANCTGEKRRETRQGQPSYPERDRDVQTAQESNGEKRAKASPAIPEGDGDAQTAQENNGEKCTKASPATPEGDEDAGVDGPRKCSTSPSYTRCHVLCVTVCVHL